MRRVATVGAVWLAVSLAVAARDNKEPAKNEPTDDEKAVVEFTNKERMKEKLPALKINPVLTSVARAHSENMAKTGMFDHVLDGKNPADRLKAAGYRCLLCGENISLGEGGFSPAEVVKGWMDSKLHKANILHPKFTEIGVGIARNGKGETYYTQVFALPR